MQPMGAIEPRQALLFLFGWLVLAILLGIGASWVWVLRRLLMGQRLLPEGPLVERRRTPWGSGTVLLAFLIYLAANVLAFQGYIWATGGTWIEKPAVAPAMPVGKAMEKADSGDPGKAVEAQPGDDDRAAKRNRPLETPDPFPPAKPETRKLSLVELMSIQAVVNMFLIVFLPVVVRGTSGARLRDLGLSLDGWRRQAAAGVVALLFLMPLVYGAQYLAMRALGPFDEESRHPVEKMLREQFSSEAAVLAFLTAVILAPLFEELMFRGLFQSWLVNLLDRSWGMVQGQFTKPMDPIGFSPRPRESDQSTSSVGTMGEFEPGFWAEDFADESPHGHPLIDEWSSEYWEVGDPIPADSKPYTPSSISAMAAIVITSAIFASLHASQWPAPIPIFILALGLGYIYHRTGSLLATICMHAVFNGSSTLMLFFALVAGVPAEGEKKIPPPALERSAPVARVKSVVPEVDRRPDRDKR
jgi:membrane protease YdiL (CAAX protease family)